MSAILDVPVTVDNLKDDQAPTSFRLTEQQRNAVAMMSVSGQSVANIARAVGRTTQTIRAALREDSDIQARISHYESKLMKQMAVHHFEMMEMLEQARANIKEGLYTNDLKTRLDTSWKVAEHVIPPQAQRLNLDLEVSGETRHEVDTAYVGISASMEGLKANQAASPPTFLKSLKDTLPGPIEIPKTAAPPTEETT